MFHSLCSPRELKIVVCLLAGVLQILAVCSGPAASGESTVSRYNWSGLYGGAVWAYTRGEAHTKFTATPAVFNAGPPGDHIDVDGLAYGTLLGVQHQWGKLVFGVEGQYLDTTVSGSARCPIATWTCAIDELSSVIIVGPRIGFADDNLLAYLSGGWASGWIKTNTYSRTQFDSSAETHEGWALGGGIEYALSPSTILGVDYMRIRLDDALHASQYALGGLTWDHRTDADLDMVRLRLLWKFTPEELRGLIK
jgi:outer membrane immunogenic protein